MLLTKLHIPLPGEHIVHRPQLFSKLNTASNYKLILLSAPAGYGKTTLLSDWIDRHTIKTAWLSLDSEENDSAGFLRYMISSIQTVLGDVGQSALDLLSSPNVPEYRSVLSLLINDLIDNKEDLFLVFDDFHLLTDKHVPPLLNYFLDNLPAFLHIVITTRSDPQISLSRLRSKQQLLEIRADELSFDASEITQLLNTRLKLRLSVSVINMLKEKTEGWIAGLQLLAVSLQRNKDNVAFIERLSGTNRFIMDYLLEEVLHTLPDDMEEFILKTSVLKHLSAPLCDYVLDRDNSQSVIEKLERLNMFVFPLDTDRQWYRYHHLFSDLLRKKLISTYSSHITNLHLKAALWLEKNGIQKQAIEHLLEIKEYDRLLPIIEAIIENLWKSGQHKTILNYGQFIPENEIAKSPVFCLYYSWTLLASGDIQQAQSLLYTAANSLKKDEEDSAISETGLKQVKTLKGKISVTLAYLYTLIADPDKILENCIIARENLGEHDPLWYSWIWYATGNARLIQEEYSEGISALTKALDYGKRAGNIFLISTIAIRLSFVQHRMGQYKEAYKLCTDLLSFLEHKGLSGITKMDWTYATLFANMAMMQFMWADLDNALQNIETAYRLSENESNILVKYVVLFGYSMVMQGRGNTKEAMDKVYQIDELLESYSITPQQKSTFLAWKAYLLLEMDQLPQVQMLYSNNDLHPDIEITYTNEHAFVGYLNMLLTQNRIKESELLITRLMELAQSGKRIERMHELSILNAYLFKLRCKEQEAVQALILSMEYAIPNDLVMYYILYHNKIGDLIEAACKEVAITQTKVPPQFIQKLKASIEQRKSFRKQDEQSELSRREIDTLKLIAEGLSNQEIAAKLFISLNTVKTHLKNINLKLNTDKRTLAVHKAKEMGII